MSKVLTRLLLVLLVAAPCAKGAAAQQTPATPPSGWVTVSPADEGFAVLMPGQPVPVEQRARAVGLNAAGRRYASAADARTSFVVWSLRGPQSTSELISQLGSPDGGISGLSPFMDRVAWMAWELLITPEVERLRGENFFMGAERATRLGLGMAYVRDFELGGWPAREYRVTLKRGRGGPVYVCADSARFYVVAGLGADASDPRLRLFADSFALGTQPATAEAVPPAPPARARRPRLENDPILVKEDPRSSAPLTMQVDPMLVREDPPEPTRVRKDLGPTYSSTEVTRKAIIIFKPEPGYTEDSRRFNVTGVVRLSAVLAATGAVTDLHVIEGLPYGLSEKALAAARQIRFQPAEKDGRAVSQHVILEYNFDTY